MEKLPIDELKLTVDLLSPNQCDFLSENCIVALEGHNHSSGCTIQITGDYTESFELNWKKKFSKAGYKEQKKIIEHGAEALAFFLTTKYTEYTIIEEACIGTGVDYWVGYSSSHAKYDPKNFIQARLEISGIDKESLSNNLSRRIKEKKEQTNASNGSRLPAYVSVIEFSTPKGYFGKK